FGFVDPSQVIRGVHLIPAFHFGPTCNLLPHSIPHQPSEKHFDYVWYYINQFVNRDMFLWFQGCGVGHKATCDATRSFLADVDELDGQEFVREWDDLRETKGSNMDTEESDEERKNNEDACDSE
ncbi:hypothetical protein SERLA73DRAFT_41223, partial [Serpula lacrymans var. lacrymans S7.3]